jgi:tyrosyl-tRNA synthetase
VNDNDIQQFLLSFTQMTLEDIKDLMIEHSAHPEQRLAQRTLAGELLNHKSYLRLIRPIIYRTHD